MHTTTLVVVALIVAASVAVELPPGCEICFGPCQTVDDSILFCQGPNSHPYTFSPQAPMACSVFDNSAHVIDGVGHGEVFDVCLKNVAGQGETPVCVCDGPPEPTETTGTDSSTDSGTDSGSGTGPDTGTEPSTTEPTDPTGCGTGGPAGNGGWDCNSLPILSGGDLTINHNEETDVEVSVLSMCGDPPVPCCRNLACQVEVCGSALQADRADRAFIVGFSLPGPCGVRSDADPCGNRDPAAADAAECADYYGEPEWFTAVNGWERRSLPSGPEDVLVMCRVFTLAEIIGTCGVDASTLEVDSTLSFDVYAETRVQGDGCTEPECLDNPQACCDASTHHVARHVTVTVAPDGEAAFDMGAVTSLDMESHLIHVEIGYNDCLCATFITLVNKPAELRDPSLEWEVFGPGVTFTATELGPCNLLFPNFNQLYDAATQECQAWTVCAVPPPNERTCPPLFCDDKCTSVTASFCVLAGEEEVPQSVSAEVDLHFCPPEDPGATQLPDVDIEVEPCVAVDAFVGKDCVTRYEEGQPLVHGSRVYFRACITDYDTAWEGIDLTLTPTYVEIVTVEADESETRVRVWPLLRPEGTPDIPYENRSFVMYSAPATHCVGWSLVANITDGEEWTVVVHYEMVADDGTTSRRLLSKGSTAERYAAEAEDAEAAGARSLLGGSGCMFGLFCGASGHPAKGSCGHGHEPVRFSCKSYEGSSSQGGRGGGGDDDGHGGWYGDDRGQWNPDGDCCPDGRRVPRTCEERWDFTWRECGYAVLACFVFAAICCLCYYGSEYHAVKTAVVHHHHMAAQRVAYKKVDPCTEYEYSDSSRT